MIESKTRFPLLGPVLTVFVSSFCIMVLELIASRLVARQVGSSLYTWTAVIGVILAGMATGNYLGGKTADRTSTPKRTLGVLFLLSACFSIMSIMIQEFLIRSGLFAGLSLPVYVIILLVLMFFAPACLLGMIGPMTLKIALDKQEKTGHTVGTIYAWGVIGSILGTFFTGYFLIAWVGSRTVIWIVAAILLVMGIIYIGGTLFRIGSLGLFMLFLGLGPMNVKGFGSAGEKMLLKEQPEQGLVYRDESRYNDIRVLRSPTEPGVLALYLNILKHNSVDPRDPGRIVYSYLNILAGIIHESLGDLDSPRVLLIGGGGYVLPQYILEKYPDSKIDVVEIDPAVTRAARKVLGLKDEPGFKIHHMDGRLFIRMVLEDKRDYDLIINDTFSSFQVPWQLTTLEFHEEVRELLAEDGVYAVNMIDVLEHGRFLGSMARTLRETFPAVQVFRLHNESEILATSKRNTFVLTGGRDLLGFPFRNYANTKLDSFSADETEKVMKKMGTMVLTDDHAPVMVLLRETLETVHAQLYNSSLLTKAITHLKEKKPDKAERVYNRVLRRDPYSGEARNNLANIHLSRKEWERAEEHLRKVIEVYPGAPEPWHNLGYIAFQKNEVSKAVSLFQKAIELKQDYAEAYNSLAIAYYRVGETRKAVKNFQAALKYNPGHELARKNLLILGVQ